MTKELSWKASFETGHSTIDEQHRGLVDSMRNISACMGGKKALEQCLEFRDLMKQHFNDEDEILDQANFPRRAQHLKDHRESMEKFDAIFSECGEACTKSKDVSCIDDLSYLLFDHFLRGDLDFKSYLQTKNLAGDKA
ncbi:MAG: hypothetical protein HN377_13235 [Alphaproteobacteria bacterium]|jgi:hemerythrin-like metal-binding protein|nr:hypothetical protein [Alphaproteobacteria bacterium]